MVDGVATAAQEEQRQAVTLDDADALGVATHRQAQARQPVAGERVGAALHYDGVRLEHGHHPVHDRREQLVVPPVARSHLQRHVDQSRAHAIIAATDVHGGAGAREELAVELVERHPAVVHERGLDAVAVVRVDVQVQHPPELLSSAAAAVEEGLDGDHDVVHVAEPAGLALAHVVHAARPVDGDLVLAAGEGAPTRTWCLRVLVSIPYLAVHGLFEIRDKYN